MFAAEFFRSDNELERAFLQSYFYKCRFESKKNQPIFLKDSDFFFSGVCFKICKQRLLQLGEEKNPYGAVLAMF